MSSPLAESVAATNADIILAASRDALRKTEQFQNAIASLAAAPSSAQALADARKELSSARRAYRQVEIAVFYADPDQPEELLALPDPDNSSRLSSMPKGFGVLGALLDAYAAPRKDGENESIKSPDEIVIQALMGEAHDLQGALSAFVAAWERNVPQNFRNRYYGRSSEESLRRIFQGYMTMIDAVLPERARGDEKADLDLTISLSALRSLYLGTYQTREGSLISGPGVRAIIEQVAGDSARSIDLGFVNASRIAEKGRTEPAERDVDDFVEQLEALKSEWHTATSRLKLRIEEKNE